MVAKIDCVCFLTVVLCTVMVQTQKNQRELYYVVGNNTIRRNLIVDEKKVNLKSPFSISNLYGYRKCLKCPPGSYITADCTRNDLNSTQCTPCPTGQFIDRYNYHTFCFPCGYTCVEKNMITRNTCAGAHREECGCVEGYYYDEEEHVCRRYKKCRKGFGAVKFGTWNKDVVCEVCSAKRTYSDVISSKQVCKVCKACAENEFRLKQCTYIADTICVDRSDLESCYYIMPRET